MINRLNNDICVDFSVQASRCVLVKKLSYFKKSELEISSNRCLIHKFLAILNYLGLCLQIWLCSHLSVRITSVTSFKFQKSELSKIPYTLSKYHLDIKEGKDFSLSVLKITYSPHSPTYIPKYLKNMKDTILEKSEEEIQFIPNREAIYQFQEHQIIIHSLRAKLLWI